ncbi:MAG: 2,3-epoxybenzoyl-CoA dihydrolase [Ilumatobacter sp.]|uniref:2,3-epoxybenzoyl-CoA dihydrolase n=1 Tax=Ilumatobacter sp. TaxID=1967498 RepID=UPI002633D15E|nr:2,3-epoxybenzoyl-CoA dihydrolase [Ilumatobacter sp.]MDJ0767918.1 2,3-epoxybenzoyl-CoA dihydrolase [Ilumatobacter sp.]
MAEPAVEPAVEFGVEPASYRHWRVDVVGPVATVTMTVDADGGLRDDYELKLNSYDLGVDIELHDIVQRLRFEHPGVKAVVLTGGLDKIFCSGANIQMLAGSSHGHKVNFCKFTNETRNEIEEAGAHSGQRWIAAVNGTAAGGGYELALACNEILLVDDRASTVSLPEVPLLAVLPGTGGLTRVVDKRHVRRDLADVFATRSEGLRGQQALDWRLVDAIAPKSGFDQLVAERAALCVAASDRPDDGIGIDLPPLGATTSVDEGSLSARHLDVTVDRDAGLAEFVVRGPVGPQPATAGQLVDEGADCWLIGATLELDHAMLHLRFNEPAIGCWTIRTAGSSDAVVAAEAVIEREPEHWLVRETQLLWARTLKRLDLSARSVVALIDEGSCFAGTLAELAIAADRSVMLDGEREGSDLPAPSLLLTDANVGWYRMSNGLSRLATRFWQRDDEYAAARELIGKDLTADDAARAGLVTFAMDDIDWDDEVPVMLAERASFSPDALTAMEANLRFVGPETVETKIFARLTAWQNWVFQRPNAVGPDGALRRYGTGSRADFDMKRV